jgi:hypothetical protein
MKRMSIMLTIVSLILLVVVIVLGVKLSSANSELSAANDEVASLQSKVVSLQNIVDLSQSSVEAKAVTINQPAGSKTAVVTFPANYSGYIVVSGTSTTNSGYAMLEDSNTKYIFNDMKFFFEGGTINKTIPVLPGNITVYFGNTNPFIGATATLTVTYHY